MNLPHGRGFYDNKLLKYEGIFKQGAFSGHGKVTYKSGLIIEGEFRDNQLPYG